jgi:hypothetical protein
LENLPSLIGECCEGIVIKVKKNMYFKSTILSILLRVTVADHSAVHAGKGLLHRGLFSVQTVAIQGIVHNRVGWISDFREGTKSKKFWEIPGERMVFF